MPRYDQKIQAIFRCRWLTRNEALLAIVLLLLGTKLIQVLSLNNWPSFKHRADPCVPATGLHDRLYQLTDKVTQAFERLGIVYWLQYGSLLGTLRYNAILPWDDDVDLAILGSSLGGLTLADLQRELRSDHVRVEYSSWGGFFAFQLDDDSDNEDNEEEEEHNNKVVARMDVMIYEKEGNYWMNRVGIERYVFWLNYRHWHRFPQRLVFPSPLPSKKLGPISVRVPREENAMLPYIFAENWWVERRPKSCSIEPDDLRLGELTRS